VASPAPVAKPWLPTYNWWPHPRDFSVTVVVSPRHATTDPEAEFDVVLRGYAGGREPLWSHAVGTLRQDDERAIALDDLDIPEPPDGGGILEVHVSRLDKPPRKAVGIAGMWIDARGRDGGGYIIPTVAIQGATKVVLRDDLQVIPGVTVTGEADTELVLLNVIDAPVDVRLVVSSAGGLQSEPATLTIGPCSAWRGSLAATVPRVRRLLAQDGGVGGLAVYSSHRILPYFAFRLNGGPVSSLDHSAPIFA
jgi:hypothetical protein